MATSSAAPLDWQTLIADIAWPFAIVVVAVVALVIVIVVMRGRGSLELRYKDLKAKLGQAAEPVESAREAAKQEVAAAEQEGDVTSLRLTFAALAASDPVAAVTTMWEHMLVALGRLVERYGIAATTDEEDNIQITTDLLLALRQNDLLTRDHVSALANLNAIHSRALFQRNRPMLPVWSDPKKSELFPDIYKRDEVTPTIASTFVDVSFELIRHVEGRLG